MSTPSKIKVATEDFVYKTVYRVTGDTESRINKRFDKAETLAEKRFSKLMDQMDSLAGQFKKFDEEQTMQSARIKTHTDQIEELQNAVFANA